MNIDQIDPNRNDKITVRIINGNFTQSATPLFGVVWVFDVVWVFGIVVVTYSGSAFACNACFQISNIQTSSPMTTAIIL